MADLAEGAGIKAQTIASFVLANERFISERDTPRYEAAREKLAGTMLLVDETSMVSSNDMLKLHLITAALGVDKLVLVGDRQQLSSIDAGKAFAMIQAGGGTTARMDQNIRQRTDQLRTVAALANIGKAGAAMKVLGDRVVEAAEPAAAAADMWLGLDPQEREATGASCLSRCDPPPRETAPEHPFVRVLTAALPVESPAVMDAVRLRPGMSCRSSNSGRIHRPRHIARDRRASRSTGTSER
ncbi:hypothetical protein WP12_06625 [Sphingomonas sp. SRS2]|nr:hypothetical protein WP12_06625 [Sphingomonas sp. SRS2]